MYPCNNSGTYTIGKLLTRLDCYIKKNRCFDLAQHDIVIVNS